MKHFPSILSFTLTLSLAACNGPANESKADQVADTLIQGKQFVVLSSMNKTVTSFGPTVSITPELAQGMIRSYLDNHPNTKDPLFIDFNFDEIFTYLAKIKSGAGSGQSTKDWGVRLYFGQHNKTSENSTHKEGDATLILVATKKNVDYYDTANKPIDYGNLCPPGTNCADTTNKDQLIYKARRIKP